MITLRGVRLVGGDGALVDLALADGRVAAVTRSEDAPAAVGGLGGRWVMPGLWDHHVHWEQWALGRSRLDLRSAPSAAAVAALVRDRLRDGAPERGAPLVGYGFHDALWPDRPTAQLLDDAAGNVPVMLHSNDGHCGWVGTALWHLLGRDDGPALVLEDDYVDVVEALRPYEARTLRVEVPRAAADAAARGVVGIVDLEGGDALGAWTDRVAAGVDVLRVECGVYPAELDRAIERGRPTGAVVDGTAGLVAQGPLKVITDGSLGTRTAYCDTPYPGVDAHPHGMLLVPPDSLEQLVRRGLEHGLRPAVHAIGDHANALVLDVFSRLGCAGRIEHAQQLRTEDVARFAALGVEASVQPAHCPDDRDIADRYWPTTSERAFPFRSLHDAGVRLLLGSDAPVAPLDPWLAVATAVRRSTDDRAPWHPEQQVPVRVALGASIRGPLTVAVGAAADLVVLDEDPLALDAAALARVRPYGTVLDGRWTAGGPA